MRRLVTLVCILTTAGCYEEDIRNSPEYSLANMRYDIAVSQARDLSEGLAFFRQGLPLIDAEQVYRDCLVQAQMATASIPDVITRRLREHELTVNAMTAKGFSQIRVELLPSDTERMTIHGVTIAGVKPPADTPAKQ